MNVYSYRRCSIELKMLGGNRWAYLIKRDESWLHEPTSHDLGSSVEDALEKAKAQIDQIRDL